MCTLYPYITFLLWSLQAAELGEWPRTKYDGSPWGTEEVAAALAGTALATKSVLVQIKGMIYIKSFKTMGYKD